MNEDIGAVRLRYQVFVVTRVVGVHEDMIAIFDAKCEGCRYVVAVIDQNGDNLQSAAVIDDSFFVDVRDNAHVLRVDLMVGHADVAIGFRRKPGAFGEVLHAFRAVDVQRTASPRPCLPDGARHQEIENAAIVVGMVMRQDDRIDISDGKSELRQSNNRAATAIDQDALFARFNKGGCSERLNAWVRNAGSQQRNLQHGFSDVATNM
ncbi:hypothetical protein AAFN47_14765 [Hoeflea sp. CAU 1731]